MKNKLLYIGVAGLFSTVGLLAIEIPVEEVEIKDKKNLPPRRADQGNPAAQKDLIPYLGVAGAPLSDVLAEHLQLKSGIMLHTIAQNSPASRGGLLKNDIVLKLNGKELNNQLDLREVVRASKVGAEIDATIIRKGEKIEKKLALGAQPADLQALANPKQEKRLQFQLGGQALNMGDIFGQLDLQDEELEALMKQLLNAEDRFFGNDLGKQIEKQLNLQLKKQLFPNRGDAAVQKAFQTSVQIHDEHGSLQLSTKSDGSQQLTAKDKEGNLVFQGPYKTEEEKAAVPDGIRKRAEGLTSIKLKDDLFNPGGR